MINILLKCPLFKNMNEKEIIKCIELLNYKISEYRKDEIILKNDSIIDRIGIILSGSVNIEYIDFLGNRTILSNLSSPQIVGEVYSILNEKLMVDIVSKENTKILFINKPNINSCRLDEDLSYIFISNLLTISLKRNLELSKRSFCVANKTIRNKISSYLDLISKQKKSNEFDIPFNREQLADYLNVDRSALSKELSKMKDEGLLDYHKYHFIIKKAI